MAVASASAAKRIARAQPTTQSTNGCAGLMPALERLLQRGAIELELRCRRDDLALCVLVDRNAFALPPCARLALRLARDPHLVEAGRHRRAPHRLQERARFLAECV